MIPNIETPRLRLKNGIWQLRKQHLRKRFEVSMGTSDRAVAEERARAVLRSFLQKHVSETWAEIVNAATTAPNKGWLWLMWQRAIRKRPTSSLTLEQLKDVALRSGGRCEVSGIKFALGVKLHPYQPSLDRILCHGAYSAGNTRLVCLAVNYCMNRWGESVFNNLSISMATRYMERLEASQSDGADAGPTFPEKLGVSG